jgi:hypothetical protein
VLSSKAVFVLGRGREGAPTSEWVGAAWAGERAIE